MERNTSLVLRCQIGGPTATTYCGHIMRWLTEGSTLQYASGDGSWRLLREEAQPDLKDDPMSWDDAQASFNLGAVSQGSGSPVTFLEATTCDDILADIRGPDGTLPDFGSILSEPGSPPPALELEVTHSDRVTQTDPAPSRDHTTPQPSPSVVVRHTDPHPRVNHRPVHTSPPPPPSVLGIHPNGETGDQYPVLMDTGAPSGPHGHGHRHDPGLGDVNWLPGRGLF